MSVEAIAFVGQGVLTLLGFAYYAGVFKAQVASLIARVDRIETVLLAQAKGR
jgi:hypothetical protein